MYRYILKRLVMLVPVIIGVAFVVFFIISMTPGDAAMLIAPEGSEAELAQIREELGLNDPLMVQFGRYIMNMLRGDLGTSYYSNRSVFSEYMARFPSTLKLASSAVIISMLISIPIGIYSALKQYSLFDNIGSLFALVGVSMPRFWIGLLLIILFALNLRMLPSGGSEGWQSLILPAITLGTGHAGLVHRMTRSSMLEVVRQDYIRTARAKGVKERVVIGKHALRNAWIPIVTVVGSQFGTSMGGSVVTETVFSWPGIGRLIIDSINRKDRPMIMGCLMLTTIFISLLNLAVDLLYAYLDPRIKAEYKK